MYEILNTINSPADVKKLNIEQLKTLADEMRQAILNRDSIIGGHVGPNLGIVETAIALHYVFDSPKVINEIHKKRIVFMKYPIYKSLITFL